MYTNIFNLDGTFKKNTRRRAIVRCFEFVTSGWGKKKTPRPANKAKQDELEREKKKDISDECNKKKKKHLEHLNQSSNHVWMCVSVYECVGFKDQV